MGCKTDPVVDGPARRKSILRAGAASNEVATAERFAWFRRQLGPDEDQVLSAKGVKKQARAIRRSLQNITALGYEAFEVERGQERIRWFHGLRLHSFIVLKLRRSGCADSVRFVRLEWGLWGLKLSGIESSEDDLRKSGGVFYPFLRSYQPIADPSSALERLDRLVLEPLQDEGKQYALEDFNCCHFSNDVEEILAPGSATGPLAQLKESCGNGSFGKIEETNLNIYDKYLDVSNEMIVDDISAMAAMIARQKCDDIAYLQ